MSARTLPFYVYVLRDDAGTPFYVGKGKGARALTHVFGLDPFGGRRAEIVAEAQAQGRGMTVEIIGWYISEADALAEETRLIRQHGSLLRGDGSLTNLTAFGRQAAISVRVEPDVKKAVEEAAKADGRTTSQYVERLLLAHLKETGRLPR